MNIEKKLSISINKKYRHKEVAKSSKPHQGGSHEVYKLSHSSNT